MKSDETDDGLPGKAETFSGSLNICLVVNIGKENKGLILYAASC